MTPEEFETKLEELVKAAPEGTTMFCTYSNEKNSDHKIHFLRGKSIEIMYDLTIFMRNQDTVRRMLITVVETNKILS